ncbi:hypothetical protein ABIC03_007061 [Bradyrhizobium sp. RT6a]|uniref:hypothetical protein n=1 Tax=Bradyrhizobium sp. RT6a TaxID=3156381 RepID=UPI00339612F7
MTDLKLSLREVIAAKKAELAEKSAELDRAWAELTELERLAASLNLVDSVASSTPRPPPNSLPLLDHVPSAPDTPTGSATFLWATNTFGMLSDSYRTHPNSPFHKLKHRVRNGYIQIIDKLVADIGDRRLSSLDADEIMRLYNKWAEGGKYAWGHALVGKMRLLFGFGMNVLKDHESTRLSVVMSKMRFKIPEARTERMTLEHVNAIRDAAHRHFGWHSIALAQAFQFELMLKQSDVVGEWVPASEPGLSDIFKGNEKWVRGIRWTNIDENLILRHTIFGGRRHEPKEIEIDLKKAPLVMEELSLLPASHPRTGPVIINDVNGLPWSQNEFRRKWRLVANEAGIPLTVKNMDSGKAEAAIPRTVPSGQIRSEGI